MSQAVATTSALPERPLALARRFETPPDLVQYLTDQPEHVVPFLPNLLRLYLAHLERSSYMHG